jgi:hypothetical protein
MGKKKFDEDKAKRRWLKRFIADPDTMSALHQVGVFNRRIEQLRSQLQAMLESIDQSDLVRNEVMNLPHSDKALPIHHYTVNGEYWWEYGDNAHEYDAKKLAQNLALFASFMERDGVGG